MVGIGPTMLAGMALVALSMVVMLRVTPEADPLAREDLAFALSVVLLGLLMMVTRRNAVSQVVGFMSLENGLILAATGAKGMPLVVEISVAFSVLVAFIVIGIFLFRIRERFDTVDVQALDRFRGRAAMSGCVRLRTASPLILAVPAVDGRGARLHAGLSALGAAQRRSPRFVTLLAAISLFVRAPAPGPYILVDDLNIVFIVLNSFVGFTTSVFSASYIAHELETGRLTPAHLRFYHAMYQVLLFAMNLALVANNIGLMWVAIELATLTTVLMVGIYRTHEALEAAWKYFILGSVGIALALFGTILVYMAARPVVGRGARRDGLDRPDQARRGLRSGAAQRRLRVPAARLRHQGRPGAAARLAARRPCRRPDADLRGALRACCSTSRSTRVLRFKMLLAANPGALAPGPLMVTMGLASLIFAGFMLYRRRDIKRLFAYSSIEHMGIIVFAFGMGGPLANFAGLLHMTMHSLTKSAIFFTVGHIAQVKGTQRIADITRPDREPSVARLGPGRRRRRHRRPAAARRVHQRVPGRELDLRAQPAAGAAAGRRAAGRVRRADAAPAGPRLRRAGGQHRAGRSVLRADRAASRRSC